MATNTAAIQALYVAYFNRPADVAGLNYWDSVVTANKGSTTAVSAAFAASAEYKATYAGMDASHVVAAIYQNLFGHGPDVAGLNYWVQLLLTNKITIDNVVTQIAGGALGTDKTAYNDKIAAATAFTNGLTTASQQLGYGGDNANNLAKAWMSTIVDDASLAAAIDPAALAKTITKVTAPFVPPMTFNLTAGPDTWVGGAGDDTVIATSADGTKNYLTAFDNIDGGAGNNTLRFVDTNTGGVFSPQVAGATVANFQNVIVASVEDVNVDSTGFAGTTNLTVTAASATATGTIVKAADTTAVTLATATTGVTNVTGGSAVSVNASAATAGNVNVTGAGLTNVSIKGGAIATVDNLDSKGVSSKGTTLTSVTLDGITATGATAAAVKGAGLTNVTLKNVAQTAGTDMTVTVSNATAGHALNVTVDTAGKGTTAVATIADAAATTVNVTAAGASSIVVNAGLAKTLTVGGAAAITVGGNAGAFTTVDASAATGAVTVKNLGSNVTSVLAGAGGLNATLNTQTSAATTTAAAINLAVTGAAGADTIDLTNVTANTTNGAGTITVSTGAGNDTIKINASQLVAGNLFDGGAGNDTLVLGNNTTAFGAGDYAVINSVVMNVETLEFKNAIAGVDASKLAFTSYTFDNTGVISGVSTQTLSSTGTALTASAAGYAAGAPSTYAGNLNVTTTNAGAALTLNADTATVNVKSSTSVIAAATIGGDLQTSLTVNTTNAANASSSPTGDNVSSATILVNGSNNTALKSIVLTGAGNVTIDASASGALTSVDASKLGGTIANGTAAKGNITGGLTYTANAAIAETITLGSGHDVVTTASSYAKMDTIVGFDAARETSTGASTSDVLIITAAELGGTSGLTLDGLTALTGTQTTVPGTVKMALAATDTTLDLAFVHAAAIAGNNVVQFQFAGNTYLFADTNHNGTLDNADFAIKLVGLVDLTGAFGIPPQGA